MQTTQTIASQPNQNNSRNPRLKAQESYPKQVQPKRLIKAELGEQGRCSASCTRNRGAAGICSASHEGCSASSASLLGEQAFCSASRVAQGLRRRFLGGARRTGLGARRARAIPSPRVRKRVLREKEPDSDENLMRDRSDQEIKMAYWANSIPSRESSRNQGMKELGFGRSV